jgi:hypothetical protein
MSGGAVFGVTVDRLCRIRSGTIGDELPFPLDSEGFLDSTAVQDGLVEALAPGALVAIPVAASVGAMVLLGEPGVGKTTAFQQLIAGVDTGSSNSAEAQVIEVDAADLTDVTFDELLGRHLRTLPAKQKKLHTGGGGTGGEFATRTDVGGSLLIIDQIDESPLVRHLAGRIRNALNGRDTSHLRLLLGCRTADYPSELSDVLRSHFGNCVLADLAPLTREEAVRLAASAEHTDGERLVATAVNVGAGVLANVPLTLGLLVRTYRQTGSLNARPTTLFSQGVTQLLAEHDETRRIVDDESTVEQKTAIAGRIAARLLLSGRRTIWLGSVLASGEQDLNAESLVGGEESCVSGSFTATKKMVSATLATGLFTGRGANRLGFRHGSFTAYLTARYLIDRDVPKAQLERLFLVAGADDSRSVPTQLREAAAWLVTLDPGRAQWLAQADPESLVAHSPIVDSYEVRALIVDALLQRAGEVELGDAPWTRGRRDLSHPGLAAQLLAALGDTKGSEPEDWPSLARVRLAVRLAREAGTLDLGKPLLDLAANDAWTPHLRQLAALTAFETNPDQAIPQLAELLDHLADVDYAARLDPDDELRGALLDMLWPSHISTERILPHLRRRRNRNLFGSYRRFEQTFPYNLSEDDLPVVLNWATGQLGDGQRASDSRSSTDDMQQLDDDISFERPVGGMDPELIEGIAERALTGEGAPDRVRDVAKLIRPRLERFDQVPLPAPVDVEDEHGQEPPAALNLRRGLARSFVELFLTDGTFDRADVWRIIDGWERGSIRWHAPEATISNGLRHANRGRLLTAADFVWAFGVAAKASSAGDDALADALAQLAAYLFDVSDATFVDLVYANQDHPIWPHVKWWFEPVALDSDQARLMRDAAGRRRATHEETPWAERDLFVATLNQWLADAAKGDIDAFWRLAWDLQAELTTGRLLPRLDDNILDFPGSAALGSNHVEMLVKAASRFLSSAHDHADEWLGTDVYDRRAWAGYLALALLERQGRLSEMPTTAWPSWLGALVWFHSVPFNAGDREVKGKLLSQAAKHAAPQLADVAATYVRGELTQGHLASEVELVEPSWHIDLADTWVMLLTELSDAITRRMEAQPAGGVVDRAIQPAERDDTPLRRGGGSDTVVLSSDESRGHALRLWEIMLGALFTAKDGRGVEIALSVLNMGATEERYRSLAVRAARSLLSANAPDHLHEVLTIVSVDHALSRAVAEGCATDFREGDFVVNLDEEQLAQLYRWLSGLFPPETDLPHEGMHIVSPEEQTRDWRDRILQQISERGSEQAIYTLAKLRDEYPNRLLITSNLLRARMNRAASAWYPPSPNELTALFEDARRRLVRSESELANLLIDVLNAIGEDLPTHGELLWDRLPQRVLPADTRLKDAWLPKMEPALSAYIAHELVNRLERRGLAVNREVLVRPTDASGAGDRTDIQVEATMRHDAASGPTPHRIAVVIEVKGPWNRELMTAQRDQLARRYLPETKSNTGIYLIGWFPLDQWTYRNDYRRKHVKTFQRNQLAIDLRDQARRISADLAICTIPFLIDIPRPHRILTEDSHDINGE